MLIWLHGALDPILLRQKLKNNKEFCQRLIKDVSYLLKEGEYLTDNMVKAKCVALAICKRTLFYHCTQTCKKFNRGLQKSMSI